MYRILIFLVFLITSYSFSQEISVVGVCTDKKGIPIDNVKVIAIKAINNIIYSDKNGLFKLEFHTIDSVQIEFRLSIVIPG